jgi:DNA-damage-inducible protein D
LSAIKNKNVFMLKTNEIKELFRRFEEAAAEYDGVECWSARELQKLL